MKEYITPKMKVAELDFADVIVTSGEEPDQSDETTPLAMHGKYFFASGGAAPDNPEFSDKYLSK